MTFQILFALELRITAGMWTEDTWLVLAVNGDGDPLLEAFDADVNFVFAACSEWEVGEPPL